MQHKWLIERAAVDSSKVAGEERRGEERRGERRTHYDATWIKSQRRKEGRRCACAVASVAAVTDATAAATSARDPTKERYFIRFADTTCSLALSGTLSGTRAGWLAAGPRLVVAVVPAPAAEEARRRGQRVLTNTWPTRRPRRSRGPPPPSPLPSPPPRCSRSLAHTSCTCTTAAAAAARYRHN